jgi:DNA-binding NarL/FixJ family response regulator
MPLTSRPKGAASTILGVTHMPLRVYLVEDSPIVFERLREYIHDEGAAVVGHAETAATAVAEIAALCPDVVVIDVALREGTGFHVLDVIGDLPEAERPARIVLTNFTRDWYRDAANRLGAEHFFDKSSQIPEMLDVLRAMSRGRPQTPAA